MALEQTFIILEGMGLFDVFLPFILIFTLVFGVMQKVKVFDDKRINTMIALVMALLTITPHVLYGVPGGTEPVLINGFPDVVNIMNNAIPGVSVLLVAILMALIVIGILGRKVELGNTSLAGWIALLAFVVVTVIFLAAAGVFRNPYVNNTMNTNPDLVALIVVILVFAIVIWFVTKDEGDRTHMSKEKLGDNLANTLMGGK